MFPSSGQSTRRFHLAKTEWACVSPCLTMHPVNIAYSGCARSRLTNLIRQKTELQHTKVSRPPFGLPELTVAVRTSLLSCRKAGKTRVFTPVREPSEESRVNTSGA